MQPLQRRLSDAGLVLVAIVLTSCSHHLTAEPATSDEHSRHGNTKLTRYESADPIADCQAAIQKGDFRFLAVGGMADTVPGIPNFKSTFMPRYSYRVIAGTSEFARDTEDIRLQQVAARYAAIYNQTLLRYLQSTGRLQKR